MELLKRLIMMITGSLPYKCPKCGTELGFKGLCWLCKEKERFNHYFSMPQTEAERALSDMVSAAKSLSKNAKGSDIYDKIKDYIVLIAAKEVNTQGLAEALIDYDVWRMFATAFKDASISVRNELIKRLLDPDCKSGDAADLMMKLAFIGDAEVLKVLHDLELNPPKWRQFLYPSKYAEFGGWSFDKEGNRQELIYPVCYALVEGDPSTDAAVLAGKVREDSCPNCKGVMVDILQIDGRDPRLGFLGINGKIRIPICPSCAGLAEEHHIRYTLDGDSEVLPYESASECYFRDEDLKYLEKNTFVLSKSPSTLFRAYSPSITIGGHAEWVQDWEYFPCPDCGKKMRLLAAVPWDLLLDGWEGTLYIEICTDCQVITCYHQQT